MCDRTTAVPVPPVPALRPVPDSVTPDRLSTTAGRPGIDGPSVMARRTSSHGNCAAHSRIRQGTAFDRHRAMRAELHPIPSARLQRPFATWASPPTSTQGRPSSPISPPGRDRGITVFAVEIERPLCVLRCVLRRRYLHRPPRCGGTGLRAAVGPAPALRSDRPRSTVTPRRNTTVVERPVSPLCPGHAPPAQVTPPGVNTPPVRNRVFPGSPARIPVPDPLTSHCSGD